MNHIPKHLKSTYDLLKKAFPQGIEDKKILYLLRALYEHMSDRNLSEVIVAFSGHEPAKVMNDIYRCSSIGPSHREVRAILITLENNGFKEWLEED